ncbi:MAG TPA: matrixin family metalloprotease [Candidatus Paceibacterota bacterium]|nr:matrixin family metalloprotease [Candidatus Paceibacterota bacterium]
MKATAGIQLILSFVAVAIAGYTLYTVGGQYFAPPCEEPLSYYVAAVDPRFGVSPLEVEDALNDAAALWNEAAGKTILVPGDEVSVSLVYSEVQETVELGEVIDAEQASYDAKRAEVEALRDRFQDARETYEANLAAFERDVDAYERQVASWNAQGGAPPGVYASLQEEERELSRRQEELNSEVADLNALGGTINEAVRDLNVLARKLNARVDRYNEHAGEDFEQGNYVEDAEGKRISVYEFENGTEFRRVLAHELGHALGMEHIENPESIMYSYNIGTSLALTPEDIGELKDVCRLE